MRPARWIVIGTATLVAGWFAFDGAHALATGDYVTPASGRFESRYGTWAMLVEGVGVDPASTPMKAAFLLSADLWLVAVGLYAAEARHSRWLMLGAAIGASWYLPFGTLLCIVQVALLLLPPEPKRAD